MRTQSIDWSPNSRNANLTKQKPLRSDLMCSHATVPIAMTPPPGQKTASICPVLYNAALSTWQSPKKMPLQVSFRWSPPSSLDLPLLSFQLSSSVGLKTSCNLSIPQFQTALAPTAKRFAAPVTISPLQSKFSKLHFGM